jgi:pimeloyl-ACP methyl ester carboxylesterase
MKCFIFLLLLLCPLLSKTQSCCGEHITEQWSSIFTSDSIYAQNQIDYAGFNRNISLRIYDALGNDCPKRPLLILVHGGAFGGGSYTQMADLAEQFTRRGYVVISAGYRLGFSSSGPLCPRDTTELIRAWYRGIQDIRGAIRWSKDRHASLRIDTNLVFAAGWSAGAYISSGIAYLDLEAEKPLQAFELPALTSGQTTILRPDLGSVNGNISLGNHTANIRGFASFSGAFLFPENIPNGRKPAALFFNNKRDDFSVPFENCDNDLWVYNCPQGFPKVCGIEAMTSTLEQQNIPYDYTVYDTLPCGHSMHQPCFPFFLEEVNKMAEFFQAQMSCNEIISIQNSPEKSRSRNIIISSNQTTLPWNLNDKKVDLFSLDGKLITKLQVNNSQILVPSLKPGTYLIHSETSMPVRLLVN